MNFCDTVYSKKRILAATDQMIYHYVRTYAAATLVLHIGRLSMMNSSSNFLNMRQRKNYQSWTQHTRKLKSNRPQFNLRMSKTGIWYLDLILIRWAFVHTSQRTEVITLKITMVYRSNWFGIHWRTMDLEKLIGNKSGVYVGRVVI